MKPEARKLLLVSHGSDFSGGAEVGLRDMLMTLRSRTPDVEVITVFPRYGSLLAEAAKLGAKVQIARVPWWAFVKGRVPLATVRNGLRPMLIPLGILQAIILLHRTRPSLVITNTITIPSHAFAAKFLRIPHYWMIREFGKDDHGFSFCLTYKVTMKLVGYLSTVVICNSQAVQEAILAYSPRATTCVLYPVIDSASITRPRRRVGDRLRATLVGRLSESKGQTTAIRAVAAARQAGVEVELTLVGPGNPEPFVGLARRLGVSDLVNIYGPTVNVGQYWEKSDVGLMCSKCEAFGRVTLEAMSAGLPVCGTTSGGTPELIQPGVNGFLSPPGDFKGLAENLMSLARDEDLRLRLGRTASDSVSRFCRARFDQELLRVLSLC